MQKHQGRIVLTTGPGHELSFMRSDVCPILLEYNPKVMSWPNSDFIENPHVDTSAISSEFLVSEQAHFQKCPLFLDIQANLIRRIKD